MLDNSFRPMRPTYMLREDADPPAFVERPATFGLPELVAVLRRRIWVIAGVCVAVVAATLIYTMFETKRYAATSTILLDSSKARPNEEIAGLSAIGAGADQAMADSQVEVIKSESVALAVLDKLKLEEDPFFYAPKPLAAIFAAWLRSQISGDDRGESPRSLALEAIKKNLVVERVGTTYAISLNYAYPDARKSAEITNAFVDAYQVKQAEDRDNQSNGTTGWLRTRLDELRQRSIAIDNELTQLRQSDVTGGNRTLALLRDLERESETYRKLYQTFLSRYQQAIEQNSLPINEVRVLSRARAPVDPVYPKKMLFLAVAAFLGVGLGAGLAILLEASDRSVRSPRDIMDRLGLDCLGLLPVIPWGAKPRGKFDHVLRHPQSIYAESLRSIWMRVRAKPTSRGVHVVGVSSILPSEGKSIVASNFALTVGSLDAKVLLIDADCRTQMLADTFAAAPADHGQDSHKSLAQITLGVQLATICPNVNEQAKSSVVMPKLLSRLLGDEGAALDCVVVNLPPLGISDVAALEPWIDHVVLVAEWGKDPLAAIASALNEHTGVSGKVLGVVLDKVQLRKLRLYDQDQTVERIATLSGKAPNSLAKRD